MGEGEGRGSVCGEFKAQSFLRERDIHMKTCTGVCTFGRFCTSCLCVVSVGECMYFLMLIRSESVNFLTSPPPPPLMFMSYNHC